jgi:hypothetical protein
MAEHVLMDNASVALDFLEKIAQNCRVLAHRNVDYNLILAKIAPVVDAHALAQILGSLVLSANICMQTLLYT